MKTISIGILSIVTEISLASAQTGRIDPGETPSNSPIFTLLEYIQIVSPFLIGVAGIIFFSSLVIFLKERKNGGKTFEHSKFFMISSLIAIFVMFSVLGVVDFIQNVAGFSGPSPVSPQPVGIPFVQ